MTTEATPDELLKTGSAFGEEDVVIAALAAGADPKKDNCEALMQSIFAGHAGCVEILLPVSGPFAAWCRIASQAVVRGDEEILRMVLPHAHRDDYELAFSNAVSARNADVVGIMLDELDLEPKLNQWRHDEPSAFAYVSSVRESKALERKHLTTASKTSGKGL